MKRKMAAVVALLALPAAGFGASTIWLESGGQTATSVTAGTATLVIDVDVDFQYGDVDALSGGLYMDNLASNVTIGAITYADPVFSTWSLQFADPVGTNLSQHIDFGAMNFGGPTELLAGPGTQKFATITLNGIGTLSAGVYHITVGDGADAELAGKGYWASLTAPPGDEGGLTPFDSTGGFTLTVQGSGGGGGGGGGATAPTVSAVQVQSGLTVDVTFSGAMGSGVTSAGNYTISGTGRGTLAANPNSVALVSGNTYRLTWTAGQMVSGGDIVITVADVQDLAGNTIGSPNSGTHTGGGMATTNNGGSTDQNGGDSNTGGTDNTTGQPDQSQQDNNPQPRATCGSGAGPAVLMTFAGLSLLPRRRRTLYLGLP